MGTLTQTVLPFKVEQVETTEEMPAANAGLALFGEFMQELGLHRWMAQEMPLPGNLRELIISKGHTGYVALYRFLPAKDCIDILAIRHQRECGFTD